MKVKIERRTTVVTSYEIDLSTLDINELKQALEDNDSAWISDQFETIEKLSELITNNSDMASKLFNVCNTYGSFGLPNEYFLDDEEYSINT